jgi:hypothetical protein
MALKIKTLREATDGRGVKLAIYGGSGVGKTTQIASLLGLLGDDDKLLIVTAEHGLLTLRQDALGVTDDPRVLVAEIASVGEAREGVEFAKSPANGVVWVVVDSVSNLAERELRATMQQKPDPRQAYGEVMLRIPALLWQLVDVAHLNVLFIFQEHRDERNEGTTKQPDMVSYYGPLVPSKAMQQAMPYIFDAVLRMEQQPNGERRFRTAKTATIAAKDRGGKLETFEPADLAALVEKIRA